MLKTKNFNSIFKKLHPIQWAKKITIFSAIILSGILFNSQVFTKNILAVDSVTAPTVTPTPTPTPTPNVNASTSTSSSLPVAGGLTPTIFLLLIASSFIGFSFFSLNKK